MTHAHPRRHLWWIPLPLLATLALVYSGCAEQIPQVDGLEVKVDSANFAEEVLQEEGVVFVDFWAPWCGPCRDMEPAVAYLSVQYDGQLKVAKVNTDDNPDLSEKYSNDGIPAFLMFRDGEVIARRLGTSTYRSLAGWVEEHLTE